MNKNLTTTNQNAKLALLKSKSMLDITNKILSKKEIKELAESFNYKPFMREDGHSERVSSIAITPDGSHFVSGSYDNTVKIWDLKSGECLKTLKGHSDWVSSVAISPDGKMIVSGSNDKTIKIWDIKSGECLKTFKMHSFSKSIAITPDGKHVVSGDITVKIWDITTGECLKTLEGHTDFIDSIAITPDGKHIISGGSCPYADADAYASAYGTLEIWDIKSGECLKTLEEDATGSAFCIAITPDGKHVVSGSGVAKIWDIKSGECLKTFEMPFFSKSIAITPDGKHVVSGDRTVEIWDIKSGECLKTLEGHTGSIDSIAITPDGKHIVSGSYDKTVKIWDIKRGELLDTANNFIEKDYQYLTITLEGCFRADDKSIDEFLRVSEEPLTQRKLTQAEIKHFRKKDDFLEVGEIMLKQKVESIESFNLKPAKTVYKISTDQNKEIEFEDNIHAWIDKDTGLMWEIKTEKNIKHRYVWSNVYIKKAYKPEHLTDDAKDAFSYAQELNANNHAGFSNWRVPTLEELKTLFPEKRNGAYTTNHPLSKNAAVQNYWSFTTHEDYKDSAWYVGFTSHYHSSSSKRESSYVRCVRSGQ